MTDNLSPSLFWKGLAGSHAELLSAHGLAEVKRQQALRYFTWQWRWRQLRGSEQMRFLLANTPLSTRLRAALEPQPLSDALWRGTPWSRADRWLYSFATRMIWDYASVHGEAAVLTLGEPSLGNPPPVVHRGAVISQDLANSALEAAAIRRWLGGRVPRSILEVGAGYGRSAYWLLALYPEATYAIVDIEPALTLSRWYLSSIYPDREIKFLHPEQATPVSVGEVDLAVSISSLQEMTMEQIAVYFELFGQTVVQGAYIKQWRRWTNPVDGISVDFDSYPVPASWRRVGRERCPVQTAFDQAFWLVGED